ncbi:putative glycerophosphoryl diester phosphodiesterase family protein [Rosellinia necatrix]|uniref:Putative glycerophosphoryl diester phosphodiesterase family protein n=1 Tax=Rosellinia necatrix TaxID=77044 RepID=A0A1S7UM35_ROSNE|nr:putative glycerophosphoryl diester phosphodiesterase family protein [Rosellinia necatrix]
MHITAPSLIAGVLAIAAAGASAIPARPAGGSRARDQPPPPKARHTHRNVELGPRPEYLVRDMDEGWLKDRLTSCLDDVNAKCTTPFRPATTADGGGGGGGGGRPATALCCTSDITLAEFKTLCGKMDGFNASAATAADYLGGTPAWRTDLYATCGTLLSHREFIAAVEARGGGAVQFTTELKAPRVPMPFQGDYTTERYEQQVVDEYVAAGVHPSRVWLQSFAFADVAYWLARAPDFGRQAVLLDQSGDAPGSSIAAAAANLSFYRDAGVRIVAPPLQYLVAVDGDGEYVPSEYAKTARRLGLGIITWSLERSGPLARVAANGDYYYSTVLNATRRDGDMYRLVDVLARKVGVLGIFSDWSATVTFYANCFGLS